MPQNNSNTSDATKRVPKSLGTDAKLIGDYTLTDLVVAVAPAAAVVLLTRSLLPPATVHGYSLQAITLPLAGLALVGGAVFVALTPTYASSFTWLTAALAFQRHAADDDHEAAREYTHVRRVLPEHDAIERTDGALVGMVHVSPPTMALATGREWQQTATAFADLLNTVVEFPIQLYSTTQDFPVDDYLATYEARLSDPDVQGNETLERLIEEYVDWYRRDLATRQMTIRDHYVVVPVHPGEVRQQDESTLDRLADVPYLGAVVDAWTASRRAEERVAMAAALDERVRALTRGLREIDGCSANRVTAPAMVDELAAYWTDADVADRDTQTAVRTTPLVGGPDR